jgi:hypothetical protein
LSNEAADKQNKQKEIFSTTLPIEVIEKMEEIIFQMRKKLPRENRKRLNKTKLCEFIFESVFSDYDENKNDSFLVKIFNRWEQISKNITPNS